MSDTYRQAFAEYLRTGDTSGLDMESSSGGFIVPDAFLQRITDRMFEFSNPYSSRPSWEERLRREVAYRSVRARLHRLRSRIADAPMDARYRLGRALLGDMYPDADDD